MFGLWPCSLQAAAILAAVDLRIALYAALGIVAGIVLFCHGFRMLQFKRLVLNTPFSKIRSASMGLVEVSGIATGPETIPAGITGAPCYYYCATAWELRESGRNREWKKVAEETLYVPFFVEDPTGRLLVNPQGADLNVHRSFRDEFNTSLFGRGSSLFPENVTTFLLRNGVGASGHIRLEEHSIQPGYSLFVLATLSENPDRGNWTATPHVVTPSSSIRLQSDFRLRAGGRDSLFQMMTGVPTTAFGGASRRIPIAPEAGEGFARSANASSRPSTSPAVSNWSSVSLDGEIPPEQGRRESQAADDESAFANAAATAVATADGPKAAVGDRPVEPVKDPGFDVNCPVALCQGTRHDPFTISSESQRELVRALAWKSTACIWGGPLLTLMSFYFLSKMLGW